jgi:pyridoxal phosphate phosphatase PHOSPHO2
MTTANTNLPSSPYKLAAFDFDYTIINANSNNVLSKLVIERKIPTARKTTPSMAELNHFVYGEEIERLGEAHRDDNTVRCNAIYAYMHAAHGITRSHMEQCLKCVEVGPAWPRLFTKLQEAGYDLIIVSDSNTFLIEAILKHNGLSHFFRSTAPNDSKIFANGAAFDSTGCLRVTPLNASFNEAGKRFNCGCQFCKRNMCKGEVVTRYLARRKNVAEVIYVGDGKIDYCAGMRLGSTDHFLVRKNMALHKLMHEPQYGTAVKARVSYWKSAEDILNLLKL